MVGCDGEGGGISVGGEDWRGYRRASGDRRERGRSLIRGGFDTWVRDLTYVYMYIVHY